MFSRKWPTRSSAGKFPYGGILALCLSLLAFSSGVFTADKVAELQARFDKENHATTKVKDLDKLGQAQFAAATSAQQAGNFNDIGFICEKFRDNVRTAFDLLKQQEPNADKHPEGYRHLELQTRRGIREVEDLLIIVPAEVRPPIEIVRGDLLEIDDELIHLLFPRHTKEPEKPSLTSWRATP
jgi:hypothetical protein